MAEDDLWRDADCGRSENISQLGMEERWCGQTNEQKLRDGSRLNWGEHRHHVSLGFKKFNRREPAK